MITRNIVYVRAGRRLGRRLVRGTVCGRGYSEHVSKCPREGFVSFESGFECKLSDGLVALLQVSGGALQPQPPDVLLQRFADQSTENAMKMKTGKGRYGRYLVQFQVIVQMPLDKQQRADDPLVIVPLGGWLHDRTSRAAKNATAGNAR